MRTSRGIEEIAKAFPENTKRALIEVGLAHIEAVEDALDLVLARMRISGRRRGAREVASGAPRCQTPWAERDREGRDDHAREACSRYPAINGMSERLKRTTGRGTLL